ncbi:hypothetical protein CISIN_1g0065083mg, partial [Citrus sinensis]
QSSVDGDVHIRFEILLNEVGSQPEVSTSVAQLGIRRIVNEGIEDRMSFSVCKKLVQVRISIKFPAYVFTCFRVT